MNNVLKFIHLRSPRSNKGGLTIGYVLDPAGKRAIITLAKCKAGENYSRELGRRICEQRYEFGKGFLVPIDPADREGSLARAGEALSGIALNLKHPSPSKA